MGGHPVVTRCDRVVTAGCGLILDRIGRTKNPIDGTGGFAAPTDATRAVCILPAIALGFPRRGRAHGHKAKDIIGRVYRYFFFTLCAEWERLSNEALPVQAMVLLFERGAPVSYRYSFEDLLVLLHGPAPAKVDAVALHRRRVEHGHLSVGLKIHCLGDGRQFSTLVEGLGGAQKILDVNYYKHSHASLCLVLPPVGSARSAILLLECIEHFIGSTLFSNPEIQIQVCSPGRLDARRSALLAIGFYLGSDTLRRYILGDLTTSFAENLRYPRGRRLVLYDAEGDFDRNFDWWKGSGKHRVVEPQLPFENGRSDLLTGSGSRFDIQNINLLATLLVHAQYQGYWNQLGMQFQAELEALLDRHVLSGLVDAPWVRTDDPESDDDDRFFAALQELVAYAFEESVRIKKTGRLFPGWHEIPARSSHGILQEVQSLLQKYRSELVSQSRLLDQGDRA